MNKTEIYTSIILRKIYKKIKRIKYFLIHLILENTSLFNFNILLRKYIIYKIRARISSLKLHHALFLYFY